MKIKGILMLEDFYEDVDFDGDEEDFKEALYDYKFVEIEDDGKVINLNTDYIVSFEI